jgi:hypothetical protein
MVWASRENENKKKAISGAARRQIFIRKVCFGTGYVRAANIRRFFGKKKVGLPVIWLE